jgi:RNA-binding protein 39
MPRDHWANELDTGREFKRGHHRSRERAPEFNRERAPEFNRERAPEFNRERAPEFNRERASEFNRERAPEFNRERDRSRDRGRNRSRERERHRSRERERERFRSRERERKHEFERQRDRIHFSESERSREGPHSHSREFDEQETRDERTIFVTHLPQRFTDQNLYDFFAKAGRIYSAKIVTDKITLKSKGIAYIEFTTVQAAQNALKTMNGQLIDGYPITVQRSEITKVSVNEPSKPALTEKANLPQNKVFVRNIYPGIGEDSLKRVFEVIGKISCMVFASDTEISGTNMAIVQYPSEEDAKHACEELNAFILGGIPLEVNLLSEKPSNASEGFFDEFYDDVDGHSYKRTSDISRSKLIMRLMREQSAISATSSLNYRPGSSCIQLSGVYDPEQEQSPFWEHEIAEDIRSECCKIGKVSHLAVQKNKSGDVFVKFSEAKAAQKAIEVFSGRWFGMRQIGCRFIPENIYNDMFFA